MFWKYFSLFLDLLDPLKEAKNHQKSIELEITIFLTVVLKFFFKLLLEITHDPQSRHEVVLSICGCKMDENYMPDRSRLLPRVKTPLKVAKNNKNVLQITPRENPKIH